MWSAVSLRILLIGSTRSPGQGSTLGWTMPPIPPPPPAGRAGWAGKAGRGGGGLARGWRDGLGGSDGRSRGSRGCDWRTCRTGRGFVGFDDGNDRLNRDGLALLDLDLRQNAGGGRGNLRVYLVGRDLQYR